MLQIVPVCRVVVSQAAPSAWALGLTWVAGAVALLGSEDAVSGASAGISGLVKYSGSTPVGLPVFDVAEPMGAPFRYRITVSNPGADFTKNYFDCRPLPPGLTINTNLGGSGYISGTPLAAGVYVVTLVAGNLNYPIPAMAVATIAIYLPNAPPVFSLEPQDQSVLAGTNVTFRTEVTGTPPFGYQWWRDGVSLDGETGASLSLTNVQFADAGVYQVVVTNSFGSVTSSVALLTLREPLQLRLQIVGLSIGNQLFYAVVSGPVLTNYVVWRSGDLQVWTPLSTNWVTDGRLQFRDPVSVGESRFYRVSLSSD